MKKMNRSVLVATLITGALLAAATTQAQLKITEVESSEANGNIDSAGDSAPDWFELSNFGSTAVNISGYQMDDNSSNFTDSVALTGITSIAAGESVIFFETTKTSLTISDFRTWWPDLSSSVQIGTYSGSGVGLSANGDEVNIFDSTGDLIDGVSFGSATAGDTFTFDDGAAGRSNSGLSESGQPGVIESSLGDIGSPGYFAGLTPVPEPSTIALASVGIAGLLALRRKRHA